MCQILQYSDLHYMGILALKVKLRAMDKVDIIYDFDHELFDSEHYDLIKREINEVGILKIEYKNTYCNSIVIKISMMPSGLSRIHINVCIDKDGLEKWIGELSMNKN